MLGAARAASGSKPSIIGILGTGSNSCLYDGEKIADQIPSLGYLLSDEGSGNHIGKLLIKSYFYREMENVDSAAFERQFAVKEKKFCSNCIIQADLLRIWRNFLLSWNCALKP